jgi:hypothetical protein
VLVVSQKHDGPSSLPALEIEGAAGLQLDFDDSGLALHSAKR